MGATMDNLAEIQTGLESLGYVSKFDGDCISIRLDGGVPAVIIVEDDQVVITCQVATLGELADENMLTFAFAALDANSRIAPYAFSLITERDDPSIANEDEYAVVLVDSIPLGDFEKTELQAAMQALYTALAGSREALQAGIGEPVAV